MGARQHRTSTSRITVAACAVVSAVVPIVAFSSASSAAGAPTLIAPANGSTVDGVDASLRVAVDSATTSVEYFGRRVGDTVPGDTDEEDFTLVVVPDTQNYTYGGRAWMIDAQTQWIVDNRQPLNIVFVAQVGDLVSDHPNTTQWTAISNGMKILDDAGVPSAVVPGNHDFDNATSEFVNYNTYFPVSRYAGASWNSPTVHYVGYMGSDLFGPDPVDRQNMNNFTVFEAGGEQFLVLSLEWEAPDPVLDWANKVVDAYPDHAVIVSTHSFIDTAGVRRSTPQRSGGNAPQTMWNELVAPNCNIKLVVNGHFHNGDLGEARRTDNNSCGQPVHQILSDYQERANGGNGWLRYYTFSPANNTITARTYSPTSSTFETDDSSAFTLPFAMTPTQPAPFVSLGTVTPASGSATLAWSALTPGRQYEWYAVAREPGQPDAVGAVNQFTVGQSPTIVDDTFTRTLTSGWGTADTGQNWAINSTVTDFRVNTGMGRITVAPGKTRTALVTDPSQDASLVGDVAVDQLPTASTFVNLVGRVGGADYRARLTVGAGGAATLRLMRNAGGVDTTLATANLSPVTAGQRWKIRFEYSGISPTTLRARIWPAAGTEPSTWNLQTTDSTAGLQTSGSLGVSVYVSSSATAAVPVSVDRFTATRLGGSPPPTTTTTTTSSTTTSSSTTSTTSTLPPTTSSTTPTTSTHPPTSTTTSTTSSTTSSTTTTTTTLPPAGPLATDSFTRTVSNGWGTATSGQSWSVSGATNRFLVSGGRGSIRISTAGTGGTATLNAVSTASTDLRFDLSFDKAGASLYAVAIARRIDGANDYRVKAIVAANGRIRLQLVRFANSAETVLADVQLPASIVHTAGSTFSVAVQVTGTSPTTLRAKLWPAGTAEPAAWQATAQDSAAALQGSGGIGFNHYMSSGASALVPLTMSVDNVRVTNV